MKHLATIGLAIIAGCAMMTTVYAQTKPPGVTSITLPGDLGYRFKSGPGAEVANARCLICHSSAYVSTQPPLDREHWTAEVGKMRKVYGAPMSDTDAQTIAEYLTREYGQP